jgi:deazaflavin-dependent oxidoreductase (nitroreductase family)
MRFVTNRLLNPAVRPLLERGLWPRTQALLETTGRKTGLPRRVPVGNGLRDGAFWIVTEHGYAADYVKNIQRNPRVRVKVGRRRWYEGTAGSSRTTIRSSGSAGCAGQSTTCSCSWWGRSS